MAGRYKVDVQRGDEPWRRRSSHKTQDDARLQSQRSIKKEPPTPIVYRITLDDVTIETITRPENVNE